MKHYAYYPGCSSMGTSAEYEHSTRTMCAELGLQVTEIPDWSCCGSTPAHAVDHTLSAALGARNLVQAEKIEAKAIITPCPSCLKNLRTTQHRLQDPDFKAKVERILDCQLPASIPIRSVLQTVCEDITSERIAERTILPLTGLKIAPYYGCMMVRPPELMDFDNPDNPVSLDQLMTSLGAEVVSFPLKTDCCGASYGVTRREVVTRLSGRLLDVAAECGADAMVTACPMCQMNLDLRQGQINRANATRHNIPVFYYTQLIGLALGLPQKALGLEKLCVSPFPMLTRMEKMQRQQTGS